MQKLILFSLILLLTLPKTVFATVGIPDSRHWVPAGWGGGGNYTTIVPDNTTPNKVYLTSDVTSPFVSTDRGDNWSWLANVGYSNDLTYDFVQSPVTPTTLWLVGESSVNKSLDGGATWTNVSSLVGVRGAKNIAIDPTNENNVYLGTSTGAVYKTNNGGTTWSSLFTPFGTGKVNSFVYVNHDGSTIVAGSAYGLVSYNIGSGVATAITLTGTNATLNADYGTYVQSGTTHLCVAAGLKIACSADDTALGSWTYTSATTATTTYYIARFGVRLLANTHLRFISFRTFTTNQYVNAKDRSDDDGATWTSIATGTLDTVNNPTEIWAAGIGNLARVIVFDPFDENTIYYTTDWRVMRSTDGGVNWTEKVKGAQDTVMSDIAIAPNGRIFSCGMDVGCQYSDDNGATWTATVPNATQSYTVYGGHYWRVLTTGTAQEWSAGQGHVIVSATLYSTAHSYQSAIVRSVDNGQTWTFIFTGLPGPLFGDAIWGRGYMRSLAKSADEQTIYAGVDGENCNGSCATLTTYGGVFKSTNNGATWASATITPRKFYNGLAVDPTDATGNTVLGATFAYNTYRTTNGGTYPWSYVSSTNYGFDVRYDSQGHPYVVGKETNGVIYKSVVNSFGQGNGAYGTWARMNTFPENTIMDGLTIDPLNDNRVFVSGTGGTRLQGYRKIYVTTDAQHGSTASWTSITGDFPSVGGCQALIVNPTEGTQGFLYCASNGGGVLKLDLADSPTVQPGVVHIGG